MRLHLVQRGRGKKTQMWKSFLSAKDNIEKDKKETTNLNFWVASLAPTTWERRW